MRAAALLALSVLWLSACFASHGPADGRRPDARAPVADGGVSVDGGSPVDGGRVDVRYDHPFAGLYRGTFDGGPGGELEVIIHGDGTVSVDVTIGGSTSSFFGTIDVDGRLRASGTLSSLGEEIDYMGRFRTTRRGHVGTGTWTTSSGATGSWTVRQVLDG
jgi:hypothetical protein